MKRTLLIFLVLISFNTFSQISIKSDTINFFKATPDGYKYVGELFKPVSLTINNDKARYCDTDECIDFNIFHFKNQGDVFYIELYNEKQWIRIKILQDLSSYILYSNGEDGDIMQYVIKHINKY